MSTSKTTAKTIKLLKSKKRERRQSRPYANDDDEEDDDSSSEDSDDDSSASASESGDHDGARDRVQRVGSRVRHPVTHHASTSRSNDDAPVSRREKKMLKLALANSVAETRWMRAKPLPQARVFRPTLDEFADPIQYIGRYGSEQRVLSVCLSACNGDGVRVCKCVSV